MKNRSTPPKLILLEKRQKFYLRTAAKDETALYEALLGQNTAQAARYIAKESQKRFGKKGMRAEDIIKTLLPRGRAVSWVAMDINICRLCQRIQFIIDAIEMTNTGHRHKPEGELKAYHAQLIYLDNIRHIIFSLPKRKDYKTAYTNGEFKDAEDIAYHFKTCTLCWRPVLLLKKQSRNLLCYKHKHLGSRDNEYVRRKNMRKTVLKVLDVLEVTIPTPRLVADKMALDSAEFYIEQCCAEDGYFPYITDHLSNMKPRDLSPKDLIRAMEEPIPFAEISDLEKAAWDYHFEDFGQHFEMYAERMVLMEAWLMAQAIHTHGGNINRKEKILAPLKASCTTASGSNWWARVLMYKGYSS